MASKQLISAKKPHDCLSNEIWNFSSSYAPFFFFKDTYHLLSFLISQDLFKLLDNGERRHY